MSKQIPEDYRLYILMRNDLDSMSVGRAAAQASHASNAFIHKYGKRSDVKQWQKQTNQGFGTAIVLSANFDKISHVLSEINKETNPSDLVYDPDYGTTTTWELFNLLDKSLYTRYFSSDTPTKSSVTFFRNEVTCAYVFGTKEQLAPILGSLPLY